MYKVIVLLCLILMPVSLNSTTKKIILVTPKGKVINKWTVQSDTISCTANICKFKVGTNNVTIKGKYIIK